MTKTTREKVSDENASYLGISARLFLRYVVCIHSQGIYVTSVASGSAIKKRQVLPNKALLPSSTVCSVSTVSAESRLDDMPQGKPLR